MKSTAPASVADRTEGNPMMAPRPLFSELTCAMMRSASPIDQTRVARLRGGAITILAVVLTLFMVVSAESANASGIASFTTGSSTSEAGAHADVFANIQLDRLPAGAVDGAPRSVILDLPPGVVGNPNAVPQCSQATIGSAMASNPGSGAAAITACGPSTLVGKGLLDTTLTDANPSLIDLAIINAEPQGDDAGRLLLAGTGTPPIYVSIGARTTTDFGLTSKSLEVDTSQLFRGLQLTLWGVPGAHTRGGQYCFASVCPDLTPSIPPDPPGLRTPFMTNPTVCDAPKVTKLDVTFHEDPAVHYQAQSTDPTPTDCEKVPFHPSIEVAPTSNRVDDAAGLNVKLTVPQNDDPDGIGTSTLRRAEVTLPEGTSINPSAGDGLQGCTDEEFGFGSDDPATCPEASKIGTVKFDVPLLPGPLEGSVYIGSQESDDPQSGKMFRLFQYAKGYGLTLKIPGYVKADPVTGQLTATFGDLKTLYGAVPDGMLDGLPQVPFSEFDLSFKGGDRAILATPTSGGTKTAMAKLTPWSGNPDATPGSSFDITSDGNGNGIPASSDLPFDPGFSAGTIDPLAGSFSPFTMNITRADGQQELKGISINMPSGLLGKVAGVPLCPEEQAAAGTCDPSTLVGSTTVSAGAGGHPLSLPGNVYFAGPYRGAPFSLSIVVHAAAGPYDLGLVVVRAPIFVDAANAKLAVPSDDLPTILKGIPLRIRSINVTLDRPGFTFNATSCDQMAVGATLTSKYGAVTEVSSPYKTSGCQNLPFQPTFKARSDGRLKFKNGAALHVDITQQPGQAAIKSVAVTLPKQLPSRLIPTINNACVQSVFEENPANCPEDSYIGTSTAITPVFDEPLTGPVYVIARAKEVPQVVVILHGQGVAQGIDLKLYGDIIIDSGGGRSKSTFHMVPDVPITSFALDLPAGPHSILDAPTYDVCQGPLKMGVNIVAQNGKRQDTNETVNVEHCPKIPGPKVVKAWVTKKGLAIKTHVPSLGRLVVSGNGLVPVARKATKNSIITANVPYTANARRGVQRHGMTVKVKVWFQPNNAAKPTTKKITVKVKQRKQKPAAKKHR